MKEKQQNELKALNNILKNCKADKGYNIAPAGGRYTIQYRLYYKSAAISEPFKYKEMQQFLRGYIFAKHNEFKGLYNKGKSIFCTMVLRLMDADPAASYCNALNYTLSLFPEVDRSNLEKELSKYI